MKSVNDFLFKWNQFDSVTNSECCESCGAKFKSQQVKWKIFHNKKVEYYSMKPLIIVRFEFDVYCTVYAHSGISRVGIYYATRHLTRPRHFPFAQEVNWPLVKRAACFYLKWRAPVLNIFLRALYIIETEKIRITAFFRHF